MLLKNHYQPLKMKLNKLKISGQHCSAHMIKSQLFENETFVNLLQYEKPNEYTDSLDVINFKIQKIAQMMKQLDYAQIADAINCPQCRMVVMVFELMEMKHITNILYCILFNKYEPNYDSAMKRSAQYLLKTEIECIDGQILAVKSIRSQPATQKSSELNESLNDKLVVS